MSDLSIDTIPWKKNGQGRTRYLLLDPFIFTIVELNPVQDYFVNYL